MLTPEQKAKIRKKEAETPEALRRNPLNDYKEGWFHITLNVRTEAPVLGFVTGDPSVPDGSADAPRCELTELGRGVEECWKTVDAFHPLCKCEELIAMPEHLHALLHLLPGNVEHLGSIINGLMIGCTHCYWDTLGIQWRAMRKEKDAAASTNAQEKALRAQWQDRDHTHSFRGPALFVRGYNDVQALTAEEVEIKRQYIRDNPRKRLIQGDRHQCFKKYRNQHSKRWTAGQAMAVIAADRTFRYNAVRCEEAMTRVLARLNADVPASANSQASDVQAPTSVFTLPSGRRVSVPVIGLDYIGNRELLFAQRKLPLVCHSADANLFELQKEAVLQAARDGAIIVSAFISPKERAICHQLMVEQLPLVEIIDNGIADRYKGVGKVFYALAENRLCQISPWAYLYQKEMKVSREMCLVMNELARIICGVRDDWWKGLDATT